MAISKKQQELDVIKWNKSVEMGADACGSFDYCAFCDKAKNNPCATAFNKSKKAMATEVAVTAVKKTTTTKTAAKKTVQKKTAAKVKAK